MAGFNQFFDDLDATDAWRYGGAVDQKFSENIYGGAELSKRDLEVPYFNTDDLIIKTGDWEEKIFRAYLYLTAQKWWAFSIEYLYEDHKQDEASSLAIKDLTTHSIPLGINFFHPSGLGVSLKGTYKNQEGSYIRGQDPFTGSYIIEDGEDDFWLVDAAVRYRLPKRSGFVTVGVTNLFDEEFQYFDTDDDNPNIMPSRFFFTKLTLALP